LPDYVRQAARIRRILATSRTALRAVRTTASSGCGPQARNPLSARGPSARSHGQRDRRSHSTRQTVGKNYRPGASLLTAPSSARLPAAHGSLRSPFAGPRASRWSRLTVAVRIPRASRWSRLTVAGRANLCRALARVAREDAVRSSGGAPDGRAARRSTPVNRSASPRRLADATVSSPSRFETWLRRRVCATAAEYPWRVRSDRVSPPQSQTRDSHHHQQ